MMRNVAIIGAADAGKTTLAASLTACCSDILAALPPIGCDGQPLATETLPVMYAQSKEEDSAKYQMYKEQLDALLGSTNPAIIANAGTRLVCGTQEEADYLRLLLDRRDLGHIDAVVAAPIPFKTSEADYWTPAMSAAKLAYAESHDALGQRVRHHSQFTKSQPTAKARKAARKRAKAGRRASR